jgi:hypothetical protein
VSEQWLHLGGQTALWQCWSLNRFLEFEELWAPHFELLKRLGASYLSRQKSDKSIARIKPVRWRILTEVSSG